MLWFQTVPGVLRLNILWWQSMRSFSSSPHVVQDLAHRQNPIKPMCFVHGFYEALLWLLNPADKGVWCLDLQFHLEAFELTILSSLWTKKFYTIILYTACLNVFLPFPKNDTKKKLAGTSHKNLFWMKGDACTGCNPQNLTKLDGNDTTAISHHPYILCHFADNTQNKPLYIHLAYIFTHPLNKHCTQHCSCTPQPST